MRHSTKLGVRTWIIVAAGLALTVAAVVALLALTPLSDASDDPAVDEIRKTIEGYEMATRTAADVPAESLPLVQKKLAELEGEATKGEHVLSESDKAGMNERYSSAIKMYCTPAVAESVGTDIGSVVDETLLAAAAQPAGLVIEVQRKVMAVEVQKKSGSEAFAWAYFWAGDVCATGYGAQNWEILEYRLLSDGETWRIDGCRSLGLLYPSDDSVEFGPFSPHDTVDYLEMTQESQLSPGQSVPLSLLKNLEASALNQD